MSNEVKIESQYLQPSTVESFFHLKARNIQGNWIQFSDYEEMKALVIVNVASNSQFTDSNYKQLNQIREAFTHEGFEILAFPCNQFHHGQPGNPEQIQKIVTEKYDVKFPLFEKVDVNGKYVHSVFQFLRTKSQLYDQQSGKAQKIMDNFTHFIIDRNGKVVNVFSPSKDLTPLRKAVHQLFV